MDDIVDHISRIGMRGGVAGFGAATLIDGDVDDHRTGLHRLHSLCRDQLRRGGAGYQHRGDDEIGATSEVSSPSSALGRCHLTADLQIVQPATKSYDTTVLTGLRLKLDF